MKSNAFLFLIILSGFILRFAGITYGMPFPLVSDEEVLIGGALRMLELKTLLPFLYGHAFDILYYPTLLPYLYLLVMTPAIGYLYIANGFPALDELGLLVLNNLELLWLLARLTSVILGTATLYIVYRVSSSITNSKIAGIASTALLSVDFMHVMLSHVARHWSATVFLIWLTAWLSIRYYKLPTLRNAISVGICSALGFGVSYIGVISICFALAAHLMCWINNKTTLLSSKAMIGGLCFSLTVILFILIHPYPLLRLMQGSVVPIYEVKTISGLITVYAFYIKALWESNPTLIIAAIIGTSCLLTSSKQGLLFGALFSICIYSIFLYKALPLEDRYILPITPVLAMLGGYGLAHLWEKTSKFLPGKILIASLYLLIVIVPFSYSTYSSFMLERLDSRIQAKNWLEENMSNNDSVLVNINTVRLEQNRQFLELQRTIDPQSLKAIDRIYLNNSNLVKEKQGFKSINFWQLSSDGVSKYDSAKAAKDVETYGFDYYIYDEYGINKTPKFHKEFASKMTEIKKFRPCSANISPPMLRTTTLVPYSLFHLIGCDRFGTEVTILHRSRPQDK